MPIYEFQCNSCGKRTSVFVRSIGASPGAVCSHCGSADLRRLVSRVAVVRSEEAALEDMAMDASLADVDENDPRSVARWVRRMSRQMGEPMDAEMEAELERLEAGEMPEEEGLGEGADEEFED